MIVFAALYAVGVIVLAPISFGIWQVRLADALLPLAIIFGWPCALGLSLGCLVANVYGGLGIIDILGGSFANIVACSLAWRIGRGTSIYKRFLATIAITLTVTIIVGGYLTLLFAVPPEFGLVGVFVGEIIAVNIIGFGIEEAIRKTKVFRL